MADRSGSRRRFLSRIAGALGAAALGGCEKLSESAWFPKVLGSAEKLNRIVMPAVTGRKAMAQEFTDADLSPTFRSNGTSQPASDVYKALAADGFADWKLEVGGLVERPRTFTREESKALPSRSQITRHDCVEGWSAIGKWKGARLSHLLDVVGVKPAARYVVFHCADPMEPDGTSPYYESIDLDDARHEQTLLAYELNGAALPVPNGAPLRLRVERQLGYKMAKYLMRLELVESFEKINGGSGGYWEDQGYQWYTGI